MPETPVLSITSDNALMVEFVGDRSVVIHCCHAKLRVPRHLIAPLVSGLVRFDDDVALPGETGHHLRITDELTLELQSDASIVVVIGADDHPADAIEVPGVQVEKLTQTLRALLKWT